MTRMQQAVAEVRKAYAAEVRSTIELLKDIGEPFTAEDIREIAGDPPIHPNQLGSSLLGHVSSGWLRVVGYVPALRPTSNSRLIKLFR